MKMVEPLRLWRIGGAPRHTVMSAVPESCASSSLLMIACTVLMISCTRHSGLRVEG